MMRNKIIYIAGHGRSGSTLLGDALASVTGAPHVGEVSFIWNHGFIDNQRCGCGDDFKSCVFWSRVAERVRRNSVDPQRQAALKANEPSNKELILGLWRQSPEYEEYVRGVGDLYQGVFQTSNSNVIIDSSKTPHHLFTLTRANIADIFVVHLIRDPRGTAYSWRKKIKRKDSKGKNSMENMSVFNNSRRWIMSNITTEVVCNKYDVRLTRVIYQKMCFRFDKLVKKICKSNNIRANNNIRDNYVYLQKTHTVWGNPKRSREGRVRVRVDDEWKHNLSFEDVIKTTILSLPLLLRYGYSIKV